MVAPAPAPGPATGSVPIPLQSPISIRPLLQSLRPSNLSSPTISASADEIALAVSNIIANRLSAPQTALLLYILNITGLDQRPDVLAKCAVAMRAAAQPIEESLLADIVKTRTVLNMGSYRGGLCDIVGTGGDGWSTFNISTASSIICSSLLIIAKHGNRASTSKSGSADVLAAMFSPQNPVLEAVSPSMLPQFYQKTNFCFLFAPNFHTGLRHVAGIRKELPHPSIFNLLGPLANPAEAAIEARVIGVKNRDLVIVFAEALVLNGAKKGMVVCGDEDIDEISCAGSTNCARLIQEADGVKIERFRLHPSDFGLPIHSLDEVSSGLTATENAAILTRLLQDELPEDHPIQHFVLMNAAALFVISGVCDTDTLNTITETGPGGGRWREGVRLAKDSIRTGQAMKMLTVFADVSRCV